MYLRGINAANNNVITKKFVYSEVGGGYSSHEVKKALEMLILAGILIPVTHTSASGIPLGSETDNAYRKMLLLDSGLMLRLLNITTGDVSELSSQILTADASALSNKVPNVTYRYVRSMPCRRWRKY